MGNRPEGFLIAEDLMLLLLDPRKGTILGEASASFLLGGALLSELALVERVEQGPKEGLLRKRKLLALGSGALPDPLLQQAWDEVAAKPRDAQTVLGRISQGLTEVVPARLAERGLVRQEEKKLMLFVTQTRYPSVDSSRERAVRSEIHGVLADGLTARPRTAALIALLSAGGSLKRVLKDTTPWSAPVKQRARDIQKGDWGAGVVSAAIAASISAIATDAGTSSSSSDGGDGGGGGE